ncbi:DUF4339 domain-containing protein [Sodalis sp. RH20]|uniref:DUF4339 domain-containing protein n=1 Tax=unclassified Sodalis (in: enterobacteria) TaxID=2636512 RepID=UPI0039B58C17
MDIVMTRWWYIANDIQHGPVTLPTLKRLLKRHVLCAQSIVWREGFNHWTRLDATPELKPLLKATPPPLPRVNNTALAVKTWSQAGRSNVSLTPSTRQRRHWLSWALPACCLALAAYSFFPLPRMTQIMLGAKTFTSSLNGPSSAKTPGFADAATEDTQWQNPVTLKKADLAGWTVRPLSSGKGSVASSFVSENAVVNFSVAEAKNQTLNTLVNYLKTNESALRFINQGTYGHTGGLPNWTGIATSTDDHDKSYVVHVTNAPDGYGILIAAINQQTTSSVSRLETLMAQLDQTFKGN